MATRNLTTTFNKYRSESISRRAKFGETRGDRGLLNPATDNYPKDLPPLWVETVDRAKADIIQIESTISKLSAAHRDRLMVVFDDGSKADTEINNQTRKITTLFNAAQKKLKSISDIKGDISDAEQKVRTNVQRALATQLQDLSVSFRKTQKEYLNKVQKLKEGGGDDQWKYLDTKDMEKGMDGSMFGAGLNEMQMQELEETEALANTRDQEIAQIAKSINELAAIFKELAVLVIDQGTILDRIDYNMEQAVEHTKKGMKELETAEKAQKSSRPLKCMAILVVLIIILVIILIMKHR